MKTATITYTDGRTLPRQLPLVEEAMGRQALALLRQVDAACAAASDLEQAVIESFNQLGFRGSLQRSW
jgi:hypothetical protein